MLTKNNKMNNKMEKENKLIVFENKNIRVAWHKKDWFYSVIDIVAILTGSPNPKSYWTTLKQRLKVEGNEVVTICDQLKMPSADGKLRLTDCANTKGIFRIIQSIPSKKAEPFKLWLAQAGQDRIDEIENPELAQNRVKQYYEMKGYPKDWIDKRLRGIAIRQELTEEWRSRGVKENRDFAILTNEISRATFGIDIQEHKNFKKIPKRTKTNLRDHMTRRNQGSLQVASFELVNFVVSYDLELIFTMLGEKSTTEITKSGNSKKFDELQLDAKKGGNIAKNAKVELEKETGKKVISNNNYLNMKKKKLIKRHKDE